MITDLKIADKMMVVAPDIRIWSARTKMQTEDFGDAKDNLPPSDLATLGVKKLCPQEKLRPFGMFKSRAVNLLSRIGIPFLPGSWLVPADKANEINKALESIKHDFDQAKDSFMTEYDSTCEDWITKHPEHAAMLQNSMASPDYVRNRISFGWRAFALRMTRNSNIKSDLANLGNNVFTDIAKEAKSVQREVFAGRDVVTQKALSPIRTLGEKLRGLAFVHPLVANAAYLTQSCLEAMPTKGNIEGASLGMVLALLTLLSNPIALEDATMRMTKGKVNATSLLMPTSPVKAEPIPIPTPARSVIQNVGLW
jgi:hypothetical protein